MHQNGFRRYKISKQDKRSEMCKWYMSMLSKPIKRGRNANSAALKPWNDCKLANATLICWKLVTKEDAMFR